jgi:hypothetical protein
MTNWIYFVFKLVIYDDVLIWLTAVLGQVYQQICDLVCQFVVWTRFVQKAELNLISLQQY